MIDRTLVAFSFLFVNYKYNLEVEKSEIILTHFAIPYVRHQLVSDVASEPGVTEGKSYWMTE